MAHACLVMQNGALTCPAAKVNPLLKRSDQVRKQAEQEMHLLTFKSCIMEHGSYDRSETTSEASIMRLQDIV